MSDWIYTGEFGQVVASRDDLMESIVPVDTIDLSSKNIGLDDMALLTAW